MELARHTVQAAVRHTDPEEAREAHRTVLEEDPEARHIGLEEVRLDSTAEVVVGSTVVVAGLGYMVPVEGHHTGLLEEDTVILRSLVAEVAAIGVVDNLDSSVVVVDCNLVAEVDSHFGADKASLIYLLVNAAPLRHDGVSYTYLTVGMAGLVAVDSMT